MTARRMISTAGVRIGSGGMGSGVDRTNRRSRSGESGPQHEVPQDPGSPAARADAQARVAQRVVHAPAERLAERHGEPRRRVDGAAPAVREPDPVELRERCPEVGGQRLERLRALVVRRARPGCREW